MAGLTDRMSKLARITVYVCLGLVTLYLACAFVSEHSHVLHNTPGASRSRMMAYFGGFLVAVIGVGVLCAYDMAHYFGWRAEEWFLQGGKPITNAPELEEANKLRAQAKPLEAIGVLREFLQKHPQEIEIMSRIAEIYSHDLSNYLAAALEYEEMIKHKLPADQWSWAALHLAKLYGKMNEPEKATALLKRIDKECGQTVAARRARKAIEAMGSVDDAEEA